MVLGLAFVLVGLLMIAVAVAERDDGQETATGTTAVPSALNPEMAPGTTAPLGSSGELGDGWASPRGGRRALRGFGEVEVTITSSTGEVCTVCLMSAVTVDQRERGLMEVTDPELGGYDGMLFEFPAEVDGAFWMRNTPMPLSIAYFDNEGGLVSRTDMAPCEDSADCPSYPADDDFRFALEVPQGQLESLGIDDAAVITINSRKCKLAN